MDILAVLQKEFNIRTEQVSSTVKLIDEGNTIPFIARYRKEVTGSLDDTVLRDLYDRLKFLRSLEERRAEVLRLIEEQGKMTEEISAMLMKAATLSEIEDIYIPFRPKKKTRASVAREKGLEPLAVMILDQNDNKTSLLEMAESFVSEEKGVESAEKALVGAGDIIAENISETAEYRKIIREKSNVLGMLVSKAKKVEDSVYRIYYEFEEKLSTIPSHRILAINRGENEEFLSVSVKVPENSITCYLESKVIINDFSTSKEFLKNIIADSYKRLIAPAIEREIRNDLSEKASKQALKIFSLNLKNLLMQPPLKSKVILGLDPAYRTGCKIAVVDETGKVLDTTVVYPTPPQSKIEEAKTSLKNLIKKHKVDVVSIGNGTASKESEIFVVDLIKEIDSPLSYAVVNEAGASVYSASKLGAEEFPQYDVSLRSAVSIARRLADPLAELVKIDPKSIGVGQYQHDIKQNMLTEGLSGVVENCVNSVGVNINTASYSLLSYIAGINNTIAKNIVSYREENSIIKSKKELLKVAKLGEKAFLQCAGFIRVPESKNILDNTAVHPESYTAAEKLLKMADIKKTDELESKLNAFFETNKIENVAAEIGVGVPTLKDIVDELKKPGRDIRDNLPKPVLRSDLMDIKDLKEGMIIQGKVTNVVDFGAFVDIGVHQDGLVHVSELSDRFIKNPTDVIAVGDTVKARVLSVDVVKKRIALSLKTIKTDNY